MEKPQEEEIRQQLSRIFASARFKEAGRSKKFLEFIVDEALSGQGNSLKENVVGISVFERSPDYDPRLDSIVRVEAGRLRTKLTEYYKEEGREDLIEIQLPKGAYAPEFARRTRPGNGIDSDGASSLNTVSLNTASTGKVQRVDRRFLIAVVAFVAALGVVLSQVRFVAEPEYRIAVLPFTPYTTDQSDRIVADKLTQRVTAEFVKLDRFAVVSSTTVRRYEDRLPSVKDIAKAVGADLLLEARTSAEASKVRVEVRLSDGAAQRKFWVGDAFVGEDLDSLAREIAHAATEAIAKQDEKKLKNVAAK